jgi:formiminoglutamase
MSLKLKEIWSNAASVGKTVPSGPLVLRGAADDRGVLAVGGRVGAAQGPKELRRVLGSFYTGLDGQLNRNYLTDQGDLPIHGDLRQSISVASDILHADLLSNKIPILVGGSHDYAYAQCAAMAKMYGPAQYLLINIDAHFDLRPCLPDGRITSGSPFFLAIERARLSGSNLIEVGIQEHCNSSELYEYAKNNGVRTYFLPQCKKMGVDRISDEIIKKYGSQVDHIALSIDLDAFSMAYAPGVSAPQANGFNADDMATVITKFTNTKKIRSLGFYELAPPLDISDHTSRLCAWAIHSFASIHFKLFS